MVADRADERFRQRTAWLIRKLSQHRTRSIFSRLATRQQQLCLIVRVNEEQFQNHVLSGPIDAFFLERAFGRWSRQSDEVRAIVFLEE
jgi:hypothetical protein